MITTIFANIDGSGVRALYTRKNVEDVAAALSSGNLVLCDSDIGAVYVSPSSVKYVQSGRRELPVSSGPSAQVTQEHARSVTPAIG